MAASNDALKLIAKSLEMLKEYQDTETDEVNRVVLVCEVIVMLEKAIDKLAV